MASFMERANAEIVERETMDKPGPRFRSMGVEIAMLRYYIEDLEKLIRGDGPEGCPFCGAMPEEFPETKYYEDQNDGKERVWCGSEGCPIEGKPILRTEWDKRPSKEKT